MLDIKRALRLGQELEALEARVVEKRAELREALTDGTVRVREVRKSDRRGTTRPNPRRRADKLARAINVSSTVQDLLRNLLVTPLQLGEVQTSSVTVADVLRLLKLGAEHEGAVRSALKKARKRGDVINVNGRWEWVDRTPPQKENPRAEVAPGAKVTQPIRVLNMEEPPSSFVGDSYRR